MHELSLVEALAGEVEEIMKKESAVKLHRVTVAIGELSGVERDALEFAFPLIAVEGSVLENVELNIVEVPVEIRCEECSTMSKPDVPHMVCGQCGSANVTIVKGKDFLIQTMEVE